MAFANISSRKRSREEDISIRVAAGEAVPAESFVLRTLSSCARALPADAQDWDVSGLVVDGQPFSRETVSCWLACGYSMVDGLSQLEPHDIQQLSTVAGLTQVLAFADAVGSSVGLLNAACSQLQQLKFVVQLPEQTLEVPVADSMYSFTDMQLMQSSLASKATIGAPLASAEQCRDAQQQVAKQLAALLRMAHVLRMQPLQDVLHRFILRSAWPGSTHLLCGVMELVFSDAVLEAALGSSSALSREAYVSSVLSLPCSLTPDQIGHSSLLRPTGPPRTDAGGTVKFNAVLLRDFAGGTAGQQVKVTLDLFGTLIGQGSMLLEVKSGESPTVILPAQLLLGFSMSDAAALDAFFEG